MDWEAIHAENSRRALEAARNNPNHSPNEVVFPDNWTVADVAAYEKRTGRKAPAPYRPKDEGKPLHPETIDWEELVDDWEKRTGIGSGRQNSNPEVKDRTISKRGDAMPDIPVFGETDDEKRRRLEREAGYDRDPPD